MGVRLAFFVGALLASAAPAFAQETCDAGFQAFKTSVYAKVRRDCALCHDGSTSAPAFATDEPRASYDRLLNYVQWGNVSASLLAVRAGNGHCELDNCNAASGKDMLQELGSWWDGGEKSCRRSGNYFTGEAQVPADLPHRSQGYATLAFDLGTIREDLGGATLAVDVQDFSTALGFGALQLRNPRLVNGQSTVHVKGIKILVNGVYDITANAFAQIDRIASFRAVGGSQQTRSLALSAESLIVLKPSAEPPTLQIAFDSIETASAGAPACKALGVFARQVWTTAISAKCDACHDGSVATTPAQARVFDLQFPTAELCAEALELVDRRPLVQSTLVGFPVRASDSHPKIDDAVQIGFYEAVKNWLSSEGLTDLD